MRNVRGSNYRRVMTEITPSLTQKARYMIQNSGKFTPRMIAILAQEFDLPCKTACEFLEHAEVIPTGTWERLPQKTQKAVSNLIDYYDNKEKD